MAQCVLIGSTLPQTSMEPLEKATAQITAHYEMEFHISFTVFLNIRHDVLTIILGKYFFVDTPSTLNTKPNSPPAVQRNDLDTGPISGWCSMGAASSQTASLDWPLGYLSNFWVA